MQPRWHIAQNEQDWLAQAVGWVRQAEAEALAARGVFHIVLAGGGTPKKLYAALAAEPHDWPRWQIWYGDERCLPMSDPERNSLMAHAAWLDKVAIPQENIHDIPAECGPEVGARRYAEALAAVGPFDLVLLGLGEDGHTASLFPGQDWGTGASAPPALPVHGAPKPPLERVSLTAARLSQAHRVVFLATGAGKHDALLAWRRGEEIPAAAICPPNGVDVFLDSAAGACLK